MDEMLQHNREPSDAYAEPQAYELGGAMTFFLGDSGDTEDGAKVLPCSQCAENRI